MNNTKKNIVYYIITIIAFLTIIISFRIAIIVKPSSEIKPVIPKMKIQGLESDNRRSRSNKKFFEYIEEDKWDNALEMIKNKTVEPNAKNPNQCYWTIAHYTADNIERLEQLIALGVDVNIKDEVGRTILHIQSYRARTRCIVWSLDNGIDPNSNDNIGQTPLHYASKMDAQTKLDGYPIVEADHELAIHILLARGADPKKTDANGNTPLDLAKIKNRQDVLPILNKVTKSLN